MTRSSAPAVVYGDFNCPYSALASERVGHVEAAKLASVEWRAVQHLPDLPPQGVAVDADLATDLQGELDRIHGLLLDGESFPARVPGRRPNTARPTAALAAAAQPGLLRRRLFRAHWFCGLDIGDPDVLDRLDVRVPGPGGPAGVDAWQTEWADLERPITPTLVHADGTVDRGLAALQTLAGVLGRQSGNPR